MFLVPVFSEDRFDYTLPSESIFPFSKLEFPSSGWALSSVYKVHIHNSSGYYSSCKLYIIFVSVVNEVF